MSEEEFNLTGIVIPEPARKERAYRADDVDELLRIGQRRIDELAENVGVGGLPSDSGAGGANDDVIDQLRAANAALRESVYRTLAETDRQSLQHEGEIDRLRSEVRELREGAQGKSEVEVASELIRRAAELASEHVTSAQEQAEQIKLNAARESESLVRENSELRAERKGILTSIEGFLSGHLANVHAHLEVNAQDDSGTPESVESHAVTPESAEVIDSEHQVAWDESDNPTPESDGDQEWDEDSLFDVPGEPLK